MDQVHITVGLVCSQTHLVVLFPVPDCIIRIDTLSNWQNPRSGYMTHGMQAIMVRKTKWKPLKLCLPRKNSKPKTGLHSWRNCGD